MRLKGLMRDRTLWFPSWNCPLKFSGALRNISQLLPTALPSPPSCSSLIWDESHGFNAGQSWLVAWKLSCRLSLLNGWRQWTSLHMACAMKTNTFNSVTFGFKVPVSYKTFYFLRHFIVTVNLHKFLEGYWGSYLGPASLVLSYTWALV